jgi:hypothetical protein
MESASSFFCFSVSELFMQSIKLFKRELSFSNSSSVLIPFFDSNLVELLS